MNPRVVHIPLEAEGWSIKRQWKRLDEVTLGVWDCPHSTPKITEDGPYVVRSQDIRSGIFRYEDAARVSEETYQERIERAEPSPGDILYSREGTYFGIAAEMPDDKKVCLGQRMVLIRPNPEALNSRFLRLWLNSPILSRHIHGFRDGTVAERLNMPTIRGLPIPEFDRNEQDGIAELLGSFDDKIELNRQMNATLEEMAQAIFRDWFVDFGPTRRKMEGTTDPVAILGGLLPNSERAAALAAVFPATLGDEGLPEGWKGKPLDEIATFLNGLALQKYPADDLADSLPVIKIAELRNGVTAKSNRASRAVPDKYVIRDGDFLFSWSGSLMAKFWTGGEGALNQHLFKVSSDDYPIWFYTQWVHRHLAEFQQIAASKATTMGHIQRGHLKAAKTVCPSDGAWELMSEVMKPITQKTIQNDLENRTLAATRDLLLPNLMSGEIRLREAEAVT